FLANQSPLSLVLIMLPAQRNMQLSPYTTLFRSLPAQTHPHLLCADRLPPRPGGTVDTPGPPGAAVPGRRHPVRHAARPAGPGTADRKSTRLNSSHVKISYADFRLKKKTNINDYY